RTERVLQAGSDLALHCNGDLGEMEAVAGAATPLEGYARARLEACFAATQQDRSTKKRRRTRGWP
ncbi:MAG: hypothetical protein AAFU50_05315, partial [Pseudomonadota bacterium]